MNTAGRTPLRALVACIAVTVPLLSAAQAPGAIVINEVESQPTDFVELYNTGPATVDISGYTIDDFEIGNGSGDPVAVGPGTMLPVGGFETVAFDGFGNPDTARLFDTGANELDSFSYVDHAVTTYGRCPDGSGQFSYTLAPTLGATNSCPQAASVWPGGAAVSLADDPNTFGMNLSGLAYQPSGTGAPGVLWATRNNAGTLYRLVWNGTIWTPDTANGWGAGKGLHYAGPVGNPDAEGVTLAAGDPNAVYVATERNDDGPNSNTSRPAVLRFDVSAAGGPLSATNDWNLTADLPGLDANQGLEAIAWVPDDFLVARGFVDEATAAAYNPATYPNHGTGLFFVGVEATGQVIAYALNSATDTFTRVATIASGFPAVMALEFEPEKGQLWAFCDDSCNGESHTLDVAQAGVNDGKFVVTNSYARPAGMANLNNEGVAIAPQAECVGGFKPVIYADDSDSAGNSLRQGTINCTVPPAPSDGDGDGVPDASDNCPAAANAGQENADGDSEGDACDSDDDGDGVADGSDNCPTAANPNQADADGDGIGTACDGNEQQPPAEDKDCEQAKKKLAKAKKQLKKAKQSGKAKRIKRAKKKVKKAKKQVKKACNP
jgi:Lamin Tail Domain/Thrombospondin type 3 repeat